MVGSGQVDAGVVGVAVGNDLGGDRADESPADRDEIAHEGERIRRSGGVFAFDGGGGGRGDAVDGSGVQAQRDLREPACACGGDAQLAQRVGERAGQGDAVDVDFQQLVGQQVEVGERIGPGGHLRGFSGQCGVSGERFAGRGVDGVVDHVVQCLAQRGRLIGLDRVEDLQLVVLVRPLQLLADSRGALDSEPLAFLRDDGLFVAALLRAFGHDLDACFAVEHVVLIVEEAEFVGGAEGGDGAGVVCLADDGEAHVRGQGHLGGLQCCHIDILPSQCVSVGAGQLSEQQ